VKRTKLRLCRSLLVSVPVVSVFLCSSTAFWLALITLPSRAVLPFTFSWNPPSPALMPLCSFTLR